MTDDELTVLMIAAEGQSMIPIGRWEKPVRDLAFRGLLHKNDDVNYVITPEGRKAMEQESGQRDRAFSDAYKAKAAPENTHVSMTLLGCKVEFDLTYDPAFIADSNTRRGMECLGGCEPEVMHLMWRVLRPGDFAIDGGANIGLLTLTMEILDGTGGHVEAFEPQTTNFNKLRRNVQLNGLENVTAINRPLWSANEDVVLSVPADTGLCTLAEYPGAVNKTPMKGLTLDRWCENYDQPCRFLKLDVEGAEEHVLAGACNMLRKGIDFISCEVNAPALAGFSTCQQDLRDFMAGMGYNSYMLHHDGAYPTRLQGDQQLVGRDNINMLFSTDANVNRAWSESIR